VLNMMIDPSGEKPKSSACFRAVHTKCALKTELYKHAVSLYKPIGCL
jgi:hypothetical protein